MAGYEQRPVSWAAVALLLALACLGFSITHTAHAADAELVTIKTPRGAKQSFILITPKNPVASVILFAGGHGALGLKGVDAMAWGNSNFVVRSRNLFAAEGLMVAVVDAPSDRQAKLNAIFRMGSAHAGDIAAVAKYLKSRANVPVWLVGTSMGTFSAAGGAIAAQGVDGLALTSTVTRARKKWNIAKSHPDGVASMALDRVRVPTLIVFHRDDGCSITPAADASKLRARLTGAATVKVVILQGGSKPRSDPCKALSHHGFIGIEAQAVKAIADFIRANSK